jgi:predicted kinase
MLSGLPGTGKSYLAAALAERFDVAVLRSDEVRKALFPEPSYTTLESGIVYLTCYALLRTLLRDAYAVVFDATNLTRAGRRRVRKLAGESGAPLLLVVTTSPPEVVAERLRRRLAGEMTAYSSDAGWDVHQKLAVSAELAGAGEPLAEPAVVVDTSVSLEPAFVAVEALLSAAGTAPVAAEAREPSHSGAR